MEKGSGEGVPSLVCPACRGALGRSPCALVCVACGKKFPVDDGIADFAEGQYFVPRRPRVPVRGGSSRIRERKRGEPHRGLLPADPARDGRAARPRLGLRERRGGRPPLGGGLRSVGTRPLGISQVGNGGPERTASGSSSRTRCAFPSSTASSTP